MDCTHTFALTTLVAHVAFVVASDLEVDCGNHGIQVVVGIDPAVVGTVPAVVGSDPAGAGTDQVELGIDQVVAGTDQGMAD